MKVTLQDFKKAGLFFAAAAAFTACKKDDEKVSVRAKVEVSAITDTTKYDSSNTLFVDAKGQSTVDLTDGNNRLKMFSAINTYNGLALRNTQVLKAADLKNLFTNTNSPFIAAYHADYAALNASGLQLRNVTASSFSAADAETERAKIESYFTEMALISNSVGLTASAGIAGKAGSYLLNAKGIETAQVIAKSLIGAFQVDYIGNVLLNKGLTADNYTLVSGKNYTQLEHNWDEAYSTLTLNPIFAYKFTDQARNTNSPELFLGSYVWEYNKTGYKQIQKAFLDGRAAIVNNDKNEYTKQALFIRTQFELALANAALGYLKKSMEASSTDAVRAHAFGEGLGFIYSLRFAAVHGGSAQFSDELINELTGSANGFWDLTAPKTTSASAKIRAKFNIQ